MPTILQHRRGTAAQNNNYAGSAGELTIDTDLNTIRVHDGGTMGGNVLVTAVGTQTLTNKTLTDPIISGGITTGSSATAGTITGTWTLTAGSTLNATYADLAEKYAADAEYEPGTVLEIGGEAEVTLSVTRETHRVAGVVTTAPAYLLNSELGGITAAIALQGRVPTKVTGKIKKGDILVSNGDGTACYALTPKSGAAIGKALEDFDGETGMIEVMIGRF